MLAFGATACLSKETRRATSSTRSTSPRAACTCCPGERRARPRSARARAADPREADVLELLQQGRSNAEIAMELRWRRDRPHPRPQHLPQARREDAPRAGHAGRAERRRRRPHTPHRGALHRGQAAVRAPISPRACRSSAIWTALSAAPLRRLSATIQRLSVRCCSGRGGCGRRRPRRGPPPRAPSGRRRRPGRRRPRLRARPRGSRAPAPAERSSRVSTFTDSECPVTTGTRTHVAVMRRSGSPSTLRVSSITLRSSVV